ncbi:BnaC08g21830D [Brassica napus]|uniref:BnaC08g21830D protein n=1 Tax=Brassica napus TaxID=3708 RepID=A0A078FTA6_BRANA|nr:BnaC08g21830D [Brassica napus]
MDGLPGHLLNKVLFKTDLRALAMLCCTNTSLQSHIHDPSFVSEYCSQIRSSLLYISSYGSTYLGCHHPHGGSRNTILTYKITPFWLRTNY